MCQFRELPLQGRAGQPHLASVALEPGWASVGQEQGGGCCPLLHLILVGQPGVPERLGPLSTSPWRPSSRVHRFQSWGWAAHIRHSGFHLCPEFRSLLQTLSAQLSQVIMEQGRVPRLKKLAVYPWASVPLSG